MKRAGRTGRIWVSSFLVGVIVLLAACSQQGSSTGARPTGSPTATPTTGAADSSQDWVRFGFDASRSGVNAGEAALTPGNMGRLHRLWQVKLPGVADSSPILLHGLALPDGSTRDVLYVT
ncbi:MAG TPA: hypothetical protein VF510_04705, partial [Ktedonobacterales bacterium]